MILKKNNNKKEIKELYKYTNDKSICVWKKLGESERAQTMKNKKNKLTNKQAHKQINERRQSKQKQLEKRTEKTQHEQTTSKNKQRKR